uniref:PIN domain-containing protein n=1 Tax=mine drainage metagenome TaxID=410659 RepID=E6Q0B1_9ZZZZ
MASYFLDATALIPLFVRGLGTDFMMRLMDETEDNRKLIAAGTPLEVYATLKRGELEGVISEQDGAEARGILRMESARMVQQPLNPAVLEAARQMLDQHPLRASEAIQLGAAVVAREMLLDVPVVFVSSSLPLLTAAQAERFEVLNPMEQHD